MVISPTFDFSRAISSSRSSRSRSFRAVAAPESARSRHSVSLATETFVSRATSSNGSPRNNRATTANLRLTEKRFGPFPSTPEGAPAPALGERSGAPSGLRPSSFVMSDTPVEAQSTSAGCLNYPCRTPDNRAASGSGKWRRAKCDRPRRQRALVPRGRNFPYLVNRTGRSFGSSFLFGLFLFGLFLFGLRPSPPSSAPLAGDRG